MDCPLSGAIWTGSDSQARRIAANIAKLPLVAPDGRCNWRSSERVPSEYWLAAETKFAKLVRDSAAEGTQLRLLEHFPMKSIS